MSNRAPVTTSSNPSQTLTAGQTTKVDKSPDFEGPNGDPLSCSAVSGNQASVTAGTEDHLITITGVARGDTRITVTANDFEGWLAQQAFTVTVPSGEPAAVGLLPSQTVASGETVAIDLSPFF